jgi:glycerol kinase
MERILIIDAGTTSVRAMLFDLRGQVKATEQLEFTQILPEPGWVEHDPDEIWTAVRLCCQKVLTYSPAAIIAIGITNQRETTVVWDKTTGKSLGNAIVWQDRRTAQFCLDLQKDQHEAQVRYKTGLLLDPYFSAAKIHWILNHYSAQSEAQQGQLLFGTIDSYLLWRLTAGKVHVTDITNASRTMLFNIREKKWDLELLQLFDIPESMLPEVKSNCAEFGYTTKELFGDAIPIVAMVGDQQSALIGQGCVNPFDSKCTIGTGSFLMINTGGELQNVTDLLNTIAYEVDHTVCYALEGSIFSAGTIITWLQDQLKIISSSSETEQLAANLKDNGGVYLVPAFTGLGAPYWDPQARAAIFGLTRETECAHLARAGLEAIAYQIKDLIQPLATVCKLESLKLDGGVTANRWLMQFISNLLQIPIRVSANKEATSLGAAYLTLLATGHIKKLSDVSALASIVETFRPNMAPKEAEKLYQQWLIAVDRTRTRG